MKIQKKTCTLCKKSKPISEFSASNRATGDRAARGGFGVGSWCKFCVAERLSPGINARRSALENKKKSLLKSGLKFCTVCEKTKPVASFNKRKASKDGLNYKCHDCSLSYSTSWRKNNPTAHKEWYQNHKEKRSADFRRWRKRKKRHLAESYANWAKKNKHIVNALRAKRHAAKLQATPKWANIYAIRAIYKKAWRLTKKTGVRHEVDHIYPLQGRFACGLHCEANLQILTKEENVRKHNRMPEEYEAYAASLKSSARKRLRARPGLRRFSAAALGGGKASIAGLTGAS